MFLINQAMVNGSDRNGRSDCRARYGRRLFGLILLMLVTKASGKTMQNKEAAAKSAAPAPAPATPAAPAVKAVAPGSPAK